jgi:hypothetical protein
MSGRAVWSVLRLRFTALSNKDRNPKKTGHAMNAVACSELRRTMNEPHFIMGKLWLFCYIIR